MPDILQYDFNSPYAGGSQLIVENTSSNSTTITTISFTVNTDMVGTPWGSLWMDGSKVNAQVNPDQTTTYVITFPKPLEIKANQGLMLNYAYSSTAGPVQIAMDPSQVMTVVDSKVTPLSIKGRCEDKACLDPAPGRRVASYYANWDIYARKFFPQNFPISHTNKLLYAFLNFDADGTVKLFDPYADAQLFPQISLMSKRYPYLKTAISIGGWTLSKNFSPMAANPTARANFIKQAVAIMKQVGMTGIDLDWEYPIVRDGQPDDGKNFVALITELKKALKAQARLDSLATGTTVNYTLSIAAPTGIDKIRAIEQSCPGAWKTLASNDGIDEFNCMAYDMHGAFDQPGPTEHQSPMATDPRSPYAKFDPAKFYNLKDFTQAFIDLGVPKQKLIMGVPIYTRASYFNVLGDTNGLWQNITGTPPGQFDQGGDVTGMTDYKCLVARDCGIGLQPPADIKLLSASDYPQGNVSQVPMGFSASTRQFFTYDDAASAKTKANFVVNNGFGGSMFWLASGDFNATDERSLIGTTTRTYQAAPPPKLGAPIDMQQVRVNVTNPNNQYLLLITLKKMFSNMVDWVRSTYDFTTDQTINHEFNKVEKEHRKFSDDEVMTSSYKALLSDYNQLYAKRYITDAERAQFLDKTSQFLTVTGDRQKKIEHEKRVKFHPFKPSIKNSIEKNKEINTIQAGLWQIKSSVNLAVPKISVAELKR